MATAPIKSQMSSIADTKASDSNLKEEEKRMARPATYHVDTDYFSVLDTPEKAYWLGTLAADGCLYYNHIKWVLQFIISEKDHEWFYAFSDHWLEVG